MKRYILFIATIFVCVVTSHAQVIFTDTNSQVTIDFDNSLSDVNNSSFSGNGLEPTPGTGRLDADAWNISGMSEGSHLFGQTHTSGDFARGSSTGGVGTGGLYAFTTDTNNKAMGVQPTGSDITPGTITLKINNNKSSSIFAFDIDYNIKVRNDQNRSSSLNFSYSFDNSSYTDITSADFTSPLSSDTNANWVTTAKSVAINSISIPPNQSFYIRWSTSDQGGSGSRDELAIDDISIVATANSNNCVEPNNQPTNLTFTNVTSNSITGNFNWALADNFLVVQTTTNNLSSLPSDGTTYNSGSTIGNGTVISYNNQTSFTSTGLQELTTYYYHIFSANDNCSGGPDYLTSSPLIGNIQTIADGNSGYYSGMDGLTCDGLKTALHQLIDNHTELSYGALWTLFQTSDDHLNDSGNQTIVWDMYSDNPSGSENEFIFVNNQCGTYSTEGDCYNREHSFPKSWWGGSTSPPQYTDAFHLIPVDGYINGIRSNLPYSEVQSGTETYVSANGTLKGSSSISIPGYNGSVFEPIDDYKGDLARNYFYMATRYEDVIAGWETSTTESDVVLDGSSFQVFEDWMLNMLITWHNNDPVSTKELERNDEIFIFQGNRNPYIDHPEYVSLIWGTGCGSDTQAPTDPSNLVAANITTSTIDLSWSASSDNVGVDHYNIYQDGSLFATSSSNSFVVTGLNAGTTYNYYVNAQDAAGNVSGISNQISATTNTAGDNEAPTTPTSLAVSNVTETTTDLSWSASTDNVGVTQYNIYQNGSFLTSTPNINYNVTGLMASTTYLFYVNAQDAAGNISNNSNQVSVTTSSAADTEAPTVPTSLAVSNVTETTTDLSWNTSTDNVGVTQYNIYQNGSLLTSTTNANYNVTGLMASTTYLFYVNAQDAAGNISNNSNQVSVTTDSPVGPVTIHEGYFESGWDGWIDGGSDCFRYTNGTHAYEGNAAIRLRDNSGNSSSMTSPTFNMSGYSSVEFNFYFKATSMENGENFIVSYDNGSGWTEIGNYARGTDFNNNTFYNVPITLDNSVYAFTNNSRFKIQCDASANNDRIYIDQIVITGTGGSAAQIINIEIAEEEIFVLEEANHESTTDRINIKNQDRSETQEITIYPNPVSDILNIKHNLKIEEIQIFDSTGKKVFKSKVNNEYIDVSRFNSGMYQMILINQEGEISIKKFIKI